MVPRHAPHPRRGRLKLVGIFEQLSKAKDAPTTETIPAAQHAARAALPVFPTHGISTDLHCTCGKFPCGPENRNAGKHPISRGWQEVATTDPDKVPSIFAPGNNVAVATGDGLLVLDIDPGKGGNESLAALQAKHGPLPETLTVRTGSGGAHYYFRALGRVSNSVGSVAGAKAPGVDVRGDGGLVVAPPSVHYSGSRYTWTNWGTAIADAPSWMLLAEAVEEPRPKNVSAFGPAGLDVLGEAAAALSRHGPAVMGKGGSDHAYRAGAVLHDWGLSEDEAEPLLRAWNEGNQPPFDVESTDGPDSLWARVWGKNYQGDFGGRRARFEARRWVERLLPGLRKREPQEEEDAPVDVVPEGSPDAFGDALAYVRMEMAARQVGKAKTRLGPFTSFAAMRSLPLEPKRYVVQNLIDEQAFGILGGEAKTSKTWLALETAVAVASGTRVAGEFEVPEAGRVCLLLTEDSASAARRRIDALFEARGLTGEALAAAHENIFVHCRSRVVVGDDDDLAYLMAQCLLLEPKLVIMDPLANLHQAEENDATAMGPIMERFLWLRDIVGTSVLLTHHNGKPNAVTGKLRGGQLLRGSSALHGHVEFGIYFMNADTKDAPSSWVNEIESETKDGPSRGRFTLRLDVEDGPDNTGARKAVWSFSRETGMAQAGNEQSVDDRVLQVLEHHELKVKDLGVELVPMGLNALAKATGIHNRRLKPTLEERLIPQGLVRVVMAGRAPKGYLLAERKVKKGKDVASAFIEGE